MQKEKILSEKGVFFMYIGKIILNGIIDGALLCALAALAFLFCFADISFSPAACCFIWTFCLLFLALRRNRI